MSVPATFDSLVLGVAEFLLTEGKYPYPDMLRHACNTLALEMKPSEYPAFPHTWRGLLTLLEKPARHWCPLEIPVEFDSDAGLIDANSLSEEASHYLHHCLFQRAGLDASMPTRVQQMALDNRRFQILMDRCHAAPDRARAAAEYTLLRSFLIEHPFTTGSEIARAFQHARLLQTSEVGALYEDCSPQDTHWRCDHCGPLTQTRERLRGLRPSVCDDHRHDLDSVHCVPYESDMRRVLSGIHWRVTLPGIPEMNLFQTLEAMQQEYPNQIQEVRRWPGIDRYDLYVRFGDGKVWAVDVKDHQNPYRLAVTLTALYSEGDLAYDEAYYVFPTRRLRNHDHYIAIVREEACSLPPSHALVSVPEFEARVAAKIQQMQQASSTPVRKARKRP